MAYLQNSEDSVFVSDEPNVAKYASVVNVVDRRARVLVAPPWNEARLDRGAPRTGFLDEPNGCGESAVGLGEDDAALEHVGKSPDVVANPTFGAPNLAFGRKPAREQQRDAGNDEEEGGETRDDLHPKLSLHRNESKTSEEITPRVERLAHVVEDAPKSSTEPRGRGSIEYDGALALRQCIDLAEARVEGRLFAQIDDQEGRVTSRETRPLRLLEILRD